MSPPAERDPYSGIVPPEFQPIVLTEAELERVSRAAAKQAIQEVFLAIGVDVSGPEGILKAQKDWAHLNRWRKAVEKGEQVTAKVAIGMIVAGIFGLIWAGFGDAIRKLLGH